MIEIIGGIWAAGETKTFHVNGEYIEILDCQYTCDVMLMDKVGAQLSIMKGCEASFFSRPREGYNTVQIYSPQAQYLRVFLGSGDAGTRRISSTVQVVDSGYRRSLAGGAFQALLNAAGTGGQFIAVGLRNWSADKRLVVKQIRVGGDNAGNWDMRSFTSAFGVAGLAIGSKLLGAPNSVAAQCRILNNGAAVAPSLTPYGRVYVQSNSTAVLRFEEQFVIPPSMGLMLMNDTPLGAGGAQLLVEMEFTEEAI